MEFMRTRALRILCLVFSLTLALPPGWCCWLLGVGCCAAASQTANASAKAAPKAKATCCHCIQEDKGDTKDFPAPKRMPPAKGWCCEIQATIPTHSQELAPDLMSMNVAQCQDASSSQVDSTLASFESFDPNQSHLHLVHCVWLC